MLCGLWVTSLLPWMRLNTSLFARFFFFFIIAMVDRPCSLALEMPTSVVVICWKMLLEGLVQALQPSSHVIIRSAAAHSFGLACCCLEVMMRMMWWRLSPHLQLHETVPCCCYCTRTHKQVACACCMTIGRCSEASVTCSVNICRRGELKKKKIDGSAIVFLSPPRITSRTQ